MDLPQVNSEITMPPLPPVLGKRVVDQIPSAELLSLSPPTQPLPPPVGPPTPSTQIPLPDLLFSPVPESISSAPLSWSPPIHSQSVPTTNSSISSPLDLPSSVSTEMEMGTGGNQLDPLIQRLDRVCDLLEEFVEDQSREEGHGSPEAPKQFEWTMIKR